MSALFYRHGGEFPGKTPANFNAAKGCATALERRACGRCGGAGRSEKWAHTGLVCYDCNGSGSRGEAPVKLYTAEALAKLNDRAAKLAKTKAAKRAAERETAETKRRAELAGNLAAFEAEFPGFRALLAENATGEFLADLRAKLEANGYLSERQVAAARTAIERAQARKARDAAARHFGTIGERVVMTVTVERVVPLQSDFGARYLFVMRAEGGEPIAYKGAAHCLPRQEGATVRIKATVERHTVYRDLPQTEISRPAAA